MKLEDYKGTNFCARIIDITPHLTPEQPCESAEHYPEGSSNNEQGFHLFMIIRNFHISVEKPIAIQIDKVFFIKK